MGPSTKPAASYHHGDLRRTLIEAAKAIVAEEQTWAFSLRELTRRAGVSHTAPYRHFPEKLDLLATVAAEGFEELTAELDVAASLAPSPQSALLAIGIAYAQFGAANPARYRLMFGTVLGPTAAGPPPLIGEAAGAARGILAQILENGVRDRCFAAPGEDVGDVEFLTLAAWSIMHGLTLLMIDGLADAQASRALFERIGLALLHGIARR